ncbi:MAG: RNA-binding transcriptional accessory protein [Desulfobulbaceae bacterium]|uniref:RNA-binding transcriptional accessory protein n=1 Tax=Candidatus Desulfatifera sulfidica TaxID=2841691 RepID=A0A8J6N6T3_9BACT|nr:RNA-binding transcriptional accessory protein [Candidatus Desulfatifera sulfidica]
MNQHQDIIAREMRITKAQVTAVAHLISDGSTVPFIARYRKEATGLLDETQITAIRDRLTQLTELNKRRNAIINSLKESNLLNSKLQQDILTAPSLTLLEDIYRPHRPKRRTRSIIAMKKGLGPLARAIYQQIQSHIKPDKFINPVKGVSTEHEALAGARDIIAEWINEDPATRAALRHLFNRQALIVSKGVKKNLERGAKFRDYFQWQEPAAKVPGHRLLALLRGENEKVLTVSMRPPIDVAFDFLKKKFAKGKNFAATQINLAAEDSYKRLLAPSLENELRSKLKEQADHEAIKVFIDNLRELLLASPLGRKRVLALDPGFRTGAKLICLDAQGQLQHSTTIYPTLSAVQSREAGNIVTELCRKYRIEAIGIGNGTAGSETEAFIHTLTLPSEIIITMVDESGASIYSASETARSEFPDHDLTVRGAVSIGRRLQDPLAELVKLDPKVIGVGQYQHDVNQTALKKSLNETVASCVNKVGVELNTASAELLAHVSGLGPVLASNIIKYRNDNGPFNSRKTLLKVPRLGSKAFEQCAGFLRIQGATNPLDASSVHPEQYKIVEQMAKDCGCKVIDLISSPEIRAKIEIDRYVTDSVGLSILNDILLELAKPGRDPRESFNQFSFAEEVNRIEDLESGMRLPGLITNVTKFGAFVDIGVHQDGLIHISQLADRFIRDPSEVVKVRQQVMVRVLEVDPKRKRIALSLRED